MKRLHQNNLQQVHQASNYHSDSNYPNNNYQQYTPSQNPIYHKQQQQQQDQNYTTVSDSQSSPSSVYNQRYPVAQYTSDFIIRENTIDEEYWRGKVNYLLNLRGTEFHNQSILISEEKCDAQNNYCFYLDGVKKDIHFLVQDVQKYLGRYCILKHEITNIRDPIRKIETQRFATWIVITREAQMEHDSSRTTIIQRISEKMTKKDFYMLLICMLGFAFSLYLLLDHWSDYKEPWKNLIKTFGILYKE